MKNYVIFTDSGCDLSRELLYEMGVRCAPLTMRISGEEYPDGEIDLGAFYKRMREGEIPKTSSVASGVFYSEFDKLLREGRDILYLGFSTGLSATYSSAHLAKEELAKVYPDRTVYTVDTRAASLGLGLLVYLCVLKRDSGASLDELYAYAEEIKMNVNHWFTVDDLIYLKRGGRISAATAAIGKLLSIKPVMYMDEGGHLTPSFKVRGRRASVRALADKYASLAKNIAGGVVFISHADCASDAKSLADLLKKRHGVVVRHIGSVGSVIGSHSGPGTLALFFIGKERQNEK